MSTSEPTPSTPPRWELFPHVADMGVRGYGRTLDEAFAEAALALTAIISEPEQVGTAQAVEIRCAADDPEVLLVDWLNTVIYEMAVRGMLFGRFEVHVQNGQLTATAYGEPVDRARHEPAVEIKGATYTALDVHQEPDGRWIAQCVVDV
jgi:SHS2 domain-containing protein